MNRLYDILLKLYNKYPYIGNLCFLDTETTGLKKDSRIIEIGAIGVMFDGFDIDISTFSSLINPGFDVDAKITELTGITNSELREAPGDEVYDRFEDFLNNVKPKKMIAHNAVFDKGKLEYNLMRVGKQFELPPFECTMKQSRSCMTKLANDKLKTLSEHFQYANTNAHRALSDTEVCAYIFCKMTLGEYDE